MTKADLGPELPIALPMQGLDQRKQRCVLRGMGIGTDPDGFISQDCKEVVSRSLEFHGAAESPFPMVQPGQLMFVEAALSHSVLRLLQCAEDGDEVAQRQRFAFEDSPFGLDGFTGGLIRRP